MARQHGSKRHCGILDADRKLEQRIADQTIEIVPLGDAPSEIDPKVIAALQAGRSAFDAGCELAQPGGGNSQ